MAIPLLPDDLDAAALTELLAAHHPGTVVAGVTVREVHEVTNTHVRIEVEYAGESALPTSFFVKMVPRNPARARPHGPDRHGPTGGASSTRSSHPGSTFRVPRVYGTAYDDTDGSLLLVMEDLTLSGCTVSDGTVGVGADAAAVALGELAVLHARYDDPARRTEVPWIHTPTCGSPYAVTMLADALAQHRDRLSPDFAAIAEIYVATPTRSRMCGTATTTP